jgi:hypothetical protein
MAAAWGLPLADQGLHVWYCTIASSFVGYCQTFLCQFDQILDLFPVEDNGAIFAKVERSKA